MKKPFIFVLHSFLLFSLFGCASNKDKVMDLISENEYEKAYSLIEEHPDELKDFRDEVTFNLAKQEAENKNYEIALEYLETNEFSGSDELRSEITKKKTDKDFLAALSKSLEEYVQLWEQEKKVFGPNAYLITQQKELDYIKPFKDKIFFDSELQELNQQLVAAGEQRIRAFENWDTDLYKTALGNLAANGDRINAIVLIDKKYPIQLQTEEAKELLNEYKELFENGLDQRMYDTVNVTYDFADDRSISYSYSITNDTDEMFEFEDTYIMPILRYAVNRNGDIVGDLYGNGPTFLRPGQSATGTITIPKEIGDIRNCWME